MSCQYCGGENCGSSGGGPAMCNDERLADLMERGELSIREPTPAEIDQETLLKTHKVEIVIHISLLAGSKGQVDVNIPDGTDFVTVMMAAEFMMHLAAQQSEAGYEKALELLVQGAMTYKT